MVFLCEPSAATGSRFPWRQIFSRRLCGRRLPTCRDGTDGARGGSGPSQDPADNLIDVHSLIEHNRVRILEMEWVDGFTTSSSSSRP